jgi:hypothetical protein
MRGFPDGTLGCGIGYEGALCAVCAAEYSKAGDECINCEGGTSYMLILVAVGVILTVVGVSGLISCYSQDKEDADEKGGAAKVMPRMEFSEALSDGLITGVTQGVANLIAGEVQAQSQDAIAGAGGGMAAPEDMAGGQSLMVCNNRPIRLIDPFDYRGIKFDDHWMLLTCCGVCDRYLARFSSACCKSRASFRVRWH